jgi:hypothetical protein
MDTCKWLITHFSKFNKQESEENTNTNTPVVKNSENTNSKLKPIDLSKREVENTISIPDEKDKKKEKKVKTLNKREISANEGGFIDLDIDIINRIQLVKLAPPVQKTQLSAFLNEVEKKLKELKKLSEVEKAKIKEQNSRNFGNEEEYEGEDNFI